MSSNRRSYILHTATLLLAVGSLAAFAAVPNPPPQVCLGSKCATTPVASSGTMKWHPGHYAQSDFYFTPSNLNATYADIDRMAAVLDGQGNPRFKGYMIQFHWADIEPTTQGTYSSAQITAINSVLSRLTTHYQYNGVTVPFRLMIRIRVESQGGTGGLPSYIVSGISGQGSDAVSASGSAGPGGYAAALWRAPVMNAYIKMASYLGSLYDASPYVEMFQALEETSIAYDGPPGDYSGSAFYTQVQNLVSGISPSWPTTIKSFGPNFGPNNTDQSWLNNAVAYASTKSWAAGGSDLLVPNNETWGELAFYNGTGGNGTDYRGKMPCVIGIEDDVYLWTSQTSAGDESYAYNTLHPSHMVWMIFPEAAYSSIAGKASQWWETGTVPALQAVNFRIAASGLACPTDYSGNCNVN
ncbi:MAG TPA: hypothetical protein VIY90_14160 [Steroidobacteraceae bacterium]